MSKNHQLTDSEYYDLDRFSARSEDMFIWYYIVDIENKLRILNGGRLGHFDGAFTKGIVNGYQGKLESECPYKYSYNEHFGGYTWSDEWSYQWRKGWGIGKILKNKETELRARAPLDV